MNYFSVLGWIFGLATGLKPVYMHLLPWDENKFLAKTYSAKRPTWIVPVAVAGLLLVAFTWYQHFTAGVDNSIILTVLFSLTAVKGIVLLFDYNRFQQAVAKMLSKDKGRHIVLIDIGTGIFGLSIILLTVFLY
ncbi:hypothetical protein [Dethiobacter alkaliphilus]|uniref:Uncharacterized protein n=1 Tax=Dethiobacter alkaliphilus AHT 1 TaxID=555088 RepID=C0GII1_DETAL|nr:hypothetical protein [Dethiobacter alkaliphilus]EEG76842.1 hypothetical protein DealDRAFT_2290 [Dethiobacter alkaliphilus AHT 1]